MTASVLAVTIAGAAAQADPARTAASAPVIVTLPDGRKIGVVDGDSLAVDGIEWRLKGFDAPEIDSARCEAERRLGELALRRVEEMLRAVAARPERIAVVTGGEVDRYKRPLGDLLIDGANVREALIAEGYARPYNGGRKKGWCSRDSRDDLVPGLPPVRDWFRRSKP